MLNAQEELQRRVANAVRGLRLELINHPDETPAMLDQAVVTTTEYGVSVEFFAHPEPKKRVRRKVTDVSDE